MDTEIVKEAKASYKENAAKYSLTSWIEERAYICGYIEAYGKAAKEIEEQLTPTLFLQKTES